jgi:hypothetical protein
MNLISLPVWKPNRPMHRFDSRKKENVLGVEKKEIIPFFLEKLVTQTVRNTIYDKYYLHFAHIHHSLDAMITLSFHVFTRPGRSLREDLADPALLLSHSENV